MRVILDMASGEDLTENAGYVFERKDAMPCQEAQMTLQAPQARLEMIEMTATCTSPPLAGRDIEALIRSIDD